MKRPPKKIKGYNAGGDIPFKKYKSQDDQTNQMISAASPILNSVVPGAGTAIGAYNSIQAPAMDYLTKVDPETGKFKNKNLAVAAGVWDTAEKLTPFGLAKTAIGPGTFQDKVNDYKTMFNFKKNANSIEDENIAMVEAQKAEEEKRKQGIIANNNLTKAFSERAYNEYKDGGEIKGSGTPKSDSIKAVVKPGSFVVPAENAEKAKAIRKFVLKTPPKKANLNQANGEDVKVSNKEHLFTPKEKEKIINKLGHEILEELAPNAEGGLELKSGGDVPKKAALYDSIYGKNNLSPQKKAALYDAIYGESSSGSKPQGTRKAPPVSKNSGTKTQIAPVTTESNGLSVDQMRGLTPSMSNMDSEPFSVSGNNLITNSLGNSFVPVAKSAPSNMDIAEQMAAPKDLTQTGNDLAKLAGGGSGGMDWMQAANFALPLFQTYMGNKMLKESGKRPIDELDPAWQQSYDANRDIKNRAGMEAKYGLSPAEMYKLNQDNLGAYNAGRFAARNYSGGSSASAFNLDRQAVNDMFNRGVDISMQDQNIKRQKQAYADTLQRPLDELNQQKVNYSRLLFDDKMRGWQQNQDAGGQLMNTGLSNIIGEKRYADEMNYRKQRDAKYGNAFK